MKRIIPCLDVYDGRVVKGIKFADLKDAGDPVASAKIYSEQGADEIVFLDISATKEKRKAKIDIVEKTVRAIGVQLTVGGGISSLGDARELINAGAGKVSINSAGIKNPSLIREIAGEFGSKSLVIAIDVKKMQTGEYHVYVNGGREDTGINALEWAKRVEALGAGEILLTSMDADGTKNGYDLDITKAVANSVNIPIIASGGCGKLEHFKEVFQVTNVTGALAASIFHFGEMSIGEVKKYLNDSGVEVRL